MDLKNNNVKNKERFKGLKFLVEESGMWCRYELGSSHYYYGVVLMSDFEKVGH